MNHKPIRMSCHKPRFVFALVLSLIPLLIGCKSTPEPGAIQLFNGTDLDNWDGFLVDSSVGKDDVWSVEDGLLICKGEPMGYLYTKDLFESYLLVVEWRWAPGTEPGNSGVLLRIHGEPMALPCSIEAQLKNGNAGDIYGFQGMKINGDPNRLFTVENHDLGGLMTGLPKVVGNEKLVGNWNRYEILLDGPNLNLSVNGKAVNSATDCDVVEGAIGLQSEGGEIQFRKVELSPL